jgi:hypothetical protein
MFKKTKRPAKLDAKSNSCDDPGALSALYRAAIIKLSHSRQPRWPGPLNPEQASGITDPVESLLKKNSS